MTAPTGDATMDVDMTRQAMPISAIAGGRTVNAAPSDSKVKVNTGDSSAASESRFTNGVSMDTTAPRGARKERPTESPNLSMEVRKAVVFSLYVAIIVAN